MEAKQTDMFAEINAKVRKAKALLRGAERLKSVEVKQRGIAGGVSLKLSTAVLVEGLDDGDAETVMVGFQNFCKAQAVLLERKAAALINPKEEVVNVNN